MPEEYTLHGERLVPIVFLQTEIRIPCDEDSQPQAIEFAHIGCC